MSDKFTNPFLTPNAPKLSQAPQEGSTAPQTLSQQMPQQQMPQQPAPQQQMPQQPAPQQQMPQQPAQQQQPYQAAQSIIRDTAASPASIQKPSPFDFANQSSPQGGGTGGGSAGGTSSQSSGGRLRYKALEFTGGVGEYYGVLIVNYLLTLITLGIYAPWAKVRKQRYFFSNTQFLGEGFQYLATGKQLFIGRIIAILALVLFSFLELLPVIGLYLSLIILVFALPFVLNRSVRFNARNLAWRDVRFGWDGSFGMALLVWVVYPVLSLFTLGLAQPLAARALRRHYAENHSFGAASFSADLGLGAFYLAWLKAILLWLFLSALFGGATAYFVFLSMGDVFQSVTSYEDLVLLFTFLPEMQKILLVLPFFGITFAAIMAGQYYFALVRHVMINHLRLEGGIRFRSSLSGFKFAMVILSNFLINIITLGFAYPYTVVRRYRYLTRAIEIRPIADMAGFIDTQVKSGYSVFEEAADIEGLSIDI